MLLGCMYEFKSDDSHSLGNPLSGYYHGTRKTEVLTKFLVRVKNTMRNEHSAIQIQKSV